MEIFYILILVGFIYFIYWIIKSTAVPVTKPLKRSSKNEINLNFPFQENAEPYCLVFDVETTGLILDKSIRPSIKSIKENNSNYPYIVEITWALLSRERELISEGHYLIKPAIKIPKEAIKIHGITNEKAEAEGYEISEILQKISKDAHRCEVIVGHNIMFDKHVIEAECIRNGLKKPFPNKKTYCTMNMGKTVMRQGKPPKLSELCVHLFGDGVTEHLNSHSSLYDSFFTGHCFFEMKDSPGYFWSK